MLMVVPSFDHRFRWSSVPAIAAVAADVVAIAGFWIVFQVFKANTFTGATIQVAREQEVISTGPYAAVRHPMYAGALLIVLATPLALGSWWGLVAFVAILAVIVWRLQAEERFLVDNLRGYVEYRSRVRYRLIPCVW